MFVCKSCEHDLAVITVRSCFGWQPRLFSSLWVLLSMVLRLSVGHDLVSQTQLLQHEKPHSVGQIHYATRRPVREVFKQRHICWCCSHVWFVFLRCIKDTNPLSDDATLAALVHVYKKTRLSLIFDLNTKSDGDHTQEYVRCSVFVPAWSNLVHAIPAYRITKVRDSSGQTEQPRVNERDVYKFDRLESAYATYGLVLRPEYRDAVNPSLEGPHLPTTDSTNEGLNETKISAIRGLLSECELSHEKCRTRRSTGKLPSRLLDLRGRNSCVYLVETPSLDHLPNLRYATLSHCWGKKKLYTLRSSNYDEILRGIPVWNLTATFRDSIAICKRLGIDFLWIDSLCIIQDSESDWEAEAPRMYDVYSNSTLNLAATAATSSTEGMFRANGFYNPVRIKLPDGTEFHLGEVKQDLDLDRLTTYSPLFSRGWVLQELCISPRVLHVTQSMLIWHCAQNIATVPPREQERLGDLAMLKLYRLKPDTLDRKGLDRLWTEIIAEYSREKLSFRKDKMIAISGLAATFGTSFDKLGIKTRYCAGLWEHNILPSLAWYPSEPPRGDPALLPVGTPSWSWLSREDPIALPDWIETIQNGPCQTVFSSCITDISLRTEIPTYIFGQLADGRIRIRGPVMYLRRRTIRSVVAETWHDFGWKVFEKTASSYPRWIKGLIALFGLAIWLRTYLRKLFESDGRYCNVVLANGRGREIGYRQFDLLNWAECRFDRRSASAIGRTFKCIMLGHYLVPGGEDGAGTLQLSKRRIIALVLEESGVVDGTRLYKRCGQLQVCHPFDAASQEGMDGRQISTMSTATSFFQKDQFEEEELILT